jgi:hypothetical protein
MIPERKILLFTVFVAIFLLGVVVIPASSTGNSGNSLINNKIVFSSFHDKSLTIPASDFKSVILPSNVVPTISQQLKSPINSSFSDKTPVLIPQFSLNNSPYRATSPYSVNKTIFAYQSSFGTVIPSSFFPDQPKTNWALLIMFDGNISESLANEIILSHNIPDGMNIVEAGTGERYYILVPKNEYVSAIRTIQSEKNATIDSTYQRTISDKIMILVDFYMDYPSSGAPQRIISKGVSLRRVNEIALFYNQDTPDSVAREIQSKLKNDNRVLCSKIMYGWWACGVNGCGASLPGNGVYY